MHITIQDVNDNAPSFANKNYKATIVENIDLNPPAKIVQVYADDPDYGSNGTVIYSIVSGNVDGNSLQIFPRGTSCRYDIDY